MKDPATLYSQLMAAFNQRAWRQSHELAKRLLPLAPNHPGVRYIAGIACMELGQLPMAIEHLGIADTLEPARADFVVNHAKALVLARRNRDAKAVADRAMALPPQDPMTMDTLGVVYTKIGDYFSAISAFRHASVLDPAKASYRYNLATSLLTAGLLDEAEAEIETCLTLEPRFWKAHLSLAQIRHQTPDSHHVRRLESLLPLINPKDTTALICIHMALAKEHEDLSNYPKAFEHLTLGKSAGRVNHDYNIKQDEALFTAITDSFAGPSLAVTTGHLSREPIFVIGMPRTGTTLVERIISSHPDVYSAGELLNFGMSLKYLSGSQSEPLIDPDTLIGARKIDWKLLGETYIASTRPATGHKPRFVDKLPHNFLYAGFIARALPNAKIICLRRNPMDTCLSNFRQLFHRKSPYFDYTFDLEDIGRYYVLFDRLMAHWREVLPGRILEVDYETLVESQETCSRQLLEFCDLPWHEACLRFEDNATPVATASAVQVRAPIYRTAIQRWRKYEPQLGRLRAVLTEAGINPG
jgi:Flp pilus assembly protein TadD